MSHEKLKEIDARSWTHTEIEYYMQSLRDHDHLVWSRVGLSGNQVNWLSKNKYHVIEVTIAADQYQMYMIELTPIEDDDIPNNSTRNADADKSINMYGHIPIINTQTSEIVAPPPYLFPINVLALVVLFLSLFICTELKSQEGFDPDLVPLFKAYSIDQIKMDIDRYDITAEDLDLDNEKPQVFIGDMEVVQVIQKPQRGYYLHILRPTLIDTIGIKQDFTKIPMYRCADRTLFVDKAIKFYYPEILPLGTVIQSFPKL